MLMGDLICGTNRCKNKIDYYNTLEESYYCERCAHAMFNPKDCTKIGSISVIKHMIRLSENLLETIKSYVKEEKLTIKWSSTLEQLNVFYDELIEIKNFLENTLKDGELKDLDKIEQRSFDLKYKITESESYRKYLFHKDMNEHRLKDEKDELKPTVAQAVRDMTHIRVEEQKIAMEERLQNCRNLYESKSPINQEIEELKQKYSEEVEMIKQQQLEDKESYEKEKEEWFAQRAEIEQELNNFKSKLNYEKAELPSISYDTLNCLYKDLVGEAISLNSCYGITFNLNEEKWMNLLKALSNFRLPQLNYYQLHYVPEDSEEVRNFMRNSIPIQNQFYFNISKQFQIEGTKYIEEFKEVAKRTLTYFYIYNTNFSSKEFCELVSATKNVKYLCFYYDLIPLDKECDFGSDMEGCKIEYLYLNYSGNSNYSYWSQNPNRFENLISAIAKCGPFAKSLKYLYIQYCDIAKEKAQEMLNKYKLNSVSLYV